MNSIPPRPHIDMLGEALPDLETDPGPMTTERTELKRYLRERIAADEAETPPPANT